MSSPHMEEPTAAKSMDPMQFATGLLKGMEALTAQFTTQLAITNERINTLEKFPHTSASQHNRIPNPEIFNGKRNPGESHDALAARLGDFIKQMELFRQVLFKDKPDIEFIRWVAFYCRGDALNITQAAGESNSSWNDLVKDLKNRFLIHEHESDVLRRFRKLRQRLNTLASLEEYCSEFSDILSLWKSTTTNMTAEQVIDKFLAGLFSEVRDKLTEERDNIEAWTAYNQLSENDIDAAFRVISRKALLRQEAIEIRAMRSRPQRPSTQPTSHTPTTVSSTQRTYTPTRSQTTRSPSNATNPAFPRIPATLWAQRSREHLCGFCGGPGHSTHQCTNPRNYTTVRLNVLSEEEIVTPSYAKNEQAQS